MLTFERLAYFIVLAVVITAFALLKRRTRVLAERLDGLKKTMNEAVIHDLKNPLTSIMGCISFLLGEETQAKQRNKLLAIAMHSCRAQMSLIESLVDTSRLESGELKPKLEPVDMRRLLGECLDDVRGTAAHLGVKLEGGLEANIPAEVAIDRELVQRSLFNLLHNALKYTPPGGKVSLSAGAVNGTVRVSITDTGVGIGKDHIGKIFGKYYRVEGADQGSRRGSGLGLYFCRMVVEAHGGAISVVSEAGRGTTIAFSIPKNGARSLAL